MTTYREAIKQILANKVEVTRIFDQRVAYNFRSANHSMTVKTQSSQRGETRRL